MNKKIIGWLLKTPAYLLLVSSVVAGYYAAINNISGVTMPVPIILTIMTILLIIGEVVQNKKDNTSYSNVERTEEEYGL